MRPKSIDYKTVLTTKEGLKIVSEDDIQCTLADASKKQRYRQPIIIHSDFREVPQRFINCLQGRSYVRPHMHILPNQWELMSWLSGEITALIFNDEGILINKILMNSLQNKVIEIPTRCYHSFIATDQGAYLEIRNCAYNPTVDRVYADWSPPEHSSQAHTYLQKLCNAMVGDNLSFDFLS